MLKKWLKEMAVNIGSSGTFYSHYILFVLVKANYVCLLKIYKNKLMGQKNEELYGGDWRDLFAHFTAFMKALGDLISLVVTY